MMIRPVGALVLAMLGLSACTALESFTFDVFAPEAEAEAGHADVRLSDPITAWKPPPLPRRKPAQAAEATPTDADPQRLVGLDFKATKALLGNPALKLDHPPAKIWAYNGGYCVFNVFFYPTLGEAVFRVLTYEATGEATGGAPQGGEAGTGDGQAGTLHDGVSNHAFVRRCFAELLVNREPPEAG